MKTTLAFSENLKAELVTTYENWIQIEIGISYSNYLKNTVVAKKKIKSQF